MDLYIDGPIGPSGKEIEKQLWQAWDCLMGVLKVGT